MHDANENAHLRNAQEMGQRAWCKGFLACCAGACLSSFTFGYNLVTMSIASLFQVPGTLEGPLNTLQLGLATSALAIGAFGISLFCGKFCDSFGRRKILLFTTGIYFAGCVWSSLSTSFLHLILSRSLIGIAAGFTSTTVPLYLSEVAVSEVRGMIGVLHQLFIVLGIVSSQAVCLYWGNGLHWRYYLVTPTVWLCLQFLLLLWFCPESPAFLAATENELGIRKSLLKIRHKSWNVDEECRFLVQMQQFSGAAGSLNIEQLLAIPDARSSLALCTLMHISQQFSGIDLLLTFLDQIFGSESKIVALYIGGVIILMSFATFFLIDAVGRRPLVLVSTLGSAISLALFSFTWAFFVSPALLVLFVISFVICFSIGLGPVTWIIATEIFPMDARASALSLCIAINWLAKAVILAGFPGIQMFLGTFAYLPSAFVLLLFYFYSLFNFIETKNRCIGYI